MPSGAEETVVVNKEPEMPTELWMLWVTHDSDGNVLPGHWLPAHDEYCLDCCKNEEQAKWASGHQESLHGIKTKPVRII